nr:hypothetical protein Iba_chr05dCG10640 [Ipomoea batatas]
MAKALIGRKNSCERTMKNARRRDQQLDNLAITLNTEMAHFTRSKQNMITDLLEIWLLRVCFSIHQLPPLTDDVRPVSRSHYDSAPHCLTLKQPTAPQSLDTSPSVYGLSADAYLQWLCCNRIPATGGAVSKALAQLASIFIPAAISSSTLQPPIPPGREGVNESRPSSHSKNIDKQTVSSVAENSAGQVCRNGSNVKSPRRGRRSSHAARRQDKQRNILGSGAPSIRSDIIRCLLVRKGSACCLRRSRALLAPLEECENVVLMSKAVRFERMEKFRIQKIFVSAEVMEVATKCKRAARGDRRQLDLRPMPSEWQTAPALGLTLRRRYETMALKTLLGSREVPRLSYKIFSESFWEIRQLPHESAEKGLAAPRRTDGEFC